jgi:acetate kinase
LTILVLNCGSSSVKYALLDPETGERSRAGLVERLGTPEARWRENGATRSLPAHDLDGALAALLTDLFASHPAAVGHRVVHGGNRFSGSVLVDAAVLATIRECVPLAPLHNPANLAGIEAVSRHWPGVPQAAVFDTAFHATLPDAARYYALPRRYAEAGWLRYGFHGTSHQFVAGRAAELLGRPLTELRLVTLHLGNGASATAVDRGRSVDTTMGFTPLEGLVMGTRSGDLDPALVIELARELGPDAAENLLNKESGLAGLSGKSNDLRDVIAGADAGDPWCRRALDVYCHRVRKAIGALAASMGGLDAIVFTAGVGENSARVRSETLHPLGFLGVHLDEAANEAGRAIITRSGSPVAALVVPTDEELAIARETATLMAGR